jgi:hypothetical protein
MRRFSLEGDCKKEHVSVGPDNELVPTGKSFKINIWRVPELYLRSGPNCCLFLSDPQ